MKTIKIAHKSKDQSQSIKVPSEVFYNGTAALNAWVKKRYVNYFFVSEVEA